MITVQRDFETDTVVVRGYVRFQSGDTTAFETVVAPRNHPDAATAIEKIEARNKATQQVVHAMDAALSEFVTMMESVGAEVREV